MVKRIVIVGGGVCGVVAARRMSENIRKLKLDGKVEVRLISKDERHYMPPLFGDVAFGEVGPDETWAYLEKALRGTLVKLGIGVVVDAKLDERKLVLDNDEQINYDYLVVCAGTRNAWDAYRGLDKALTVYELEAAVKLREVLRGFKGGNIVILVPEFPYRCPGYAFELAAKIKAMALHREIGKDTNIVISYNIPLERALGRFFDVAREAMAIHSELGGIDYLFGAKLEEINAEKREIIFENGEKLRYDLVIATPPPRPPTPFDKTSLVSRDDPRFLEARFPSFRSKKYDEVFIPTDNVMPSLHIPLAGVPVHYAAITAADVITNEVAGLPQDPKFPDNLAFFLDFGVTGAMVAFDIHYSGGDKPETKPYTALVHPVFRNIKRSYYLGWLASIRGRG